MKQRVINPPPVLAPFERGLATRSPDSQDEPTMPSARNIRMVDIRLIDPNPLAPREVYTPAMLLDRAEALRTQGQHDPIHIIPHPETEGRFIICDGWTRVLSCIEYKVLSELLAEIHENLTLQEAAWFGYTQNEERQQHCDLDRALFYKKLLAGGEIAAAIARRAKISRSQMTCYQAFANLPEDLLEIAREYPHQFSYNVAYQLHKLSGKCGVKRAVTVARRFIDETQTFRWLESQVQSAVNPTPHKPTTASKHVRFSNGYFKQRGDSFEVQMAVMDAEKREVFAKALEELLNTVATKTADTTAPSGTDIPDTEA